MKVVLFFQLTILLIPLHIPQNKQSKFLWNGHMIGLIDLLGLTFPIVIKNTIQDLIFFALLNKY
tara:strand:+ start:25 stop:216 length:192 start_codon:yes stop_codon:yes gene_type:complete